MRVERKEGQAGGRIDGWRTGEMQSRERRGEEDGGRKRRMKSHTATESPFPQSRHDVDVQARYRNVQRVREGVDGCDCRDSLDKDAEDRLRRLTAEKDYPDHRPLTERQDHAQRATDQKRHQGLDPGFPSSLNLALLANREDF